jgi:hypothetical protein
VVREAFRDPFTGASVELDRMFIPARLTDNPRLLARDPLYVARLQQTGSAELVKAWLEGDWNIVQGAFFDKWSSRNIIRPFPVPRFWNRLRSFDWGYAAPFSVGWWAIASDDYEHEAGLLPRGALIRYREWYGRDPATRAGLRLEAEAVAGGILERDRDETINGGVADPSIFSENGGPSISERMRRVGVWFRAADNTRVGKAGALAGWDQMRARIVGDGERPMLYVFDTCRDFIRTVPVLQHDPQRLEDLDTGAEDHIADETRYACLARMMAARPSVPARNPSDLGGRRHEPEPSSLKML